MTPDDIRHATFDRVRRGVDPEQVMDLLARVAFLLEKSPAIDLDESDDPGASIIDLDQRTPERPVERITIREPVVDHHMLAGKLGAVIAATEELVRWKAELERTARPVEVAAAEASAPPTDSHTAVPARSTALPSQLIEIDGLDDVRQHLAETRRSGDEWFDADDEARDDGWFEGGEEPFEPVDARTDAASSRNGARIHV